MTSEKTGKKKIFAIAALAFIAVLAIAASATQASTQNAATAQVAASNRIMLQTQATNDSACCSCECAQVRLQERASVNASADGDQCQARLQIRSMNCTSGDGSEPLSLQHRQQAQLNNSFGSCTGHQQTMLKNCARTGK
uniref:Uncharacterized protein n=1 Tax=Candidatus Methanomethylicus mesodigestus TaxID=1867258 RepID=A0A7C3FA96_9CREN